MKTLILSIARVALLAMAVFSVLAKEAGNPTEAGTAFAPTIPNKTAPPGPAPEGMVWIPGGEFSMGSDGKSSCSPATVADALPIHCVYVDGFWMDATDVTNADFEKFVKATGYVTIAERATTKEEFPTAPPENLVAAACERHDLENRNREDLPSSAAVAHLDTTIGGTRALSSILARPDEGI